MGLRVDVSFPNTVADEQFNRARDHEREIVDEKFPLLPVDVEGAARGAELSATPSNYTQIAAQEGPGDVVLLESGIYSGNLSASSTGTADAWIAFEAAPGALPIFDGEGSPWGSGVGHGDADADTDTDADMNNEATGDDTSASCGCARIGASALGINGLIEMLLFY